MNAMSPIVAQGIAVEVEPDDLRGRITAFCQHVNWFGVACSLAFQGMFAAMLISLGVVAVHTKREALTVLDLRQESRPPAAPAPPAPPKAEVKPVIQPQPKADVIAPQPKIVIQPVSEPVAAAVEAPPAPVAAPAPKAAAAPASAGSGPVSVGNLATNLMSGAPPAYPMGSRRKREQGTVVLRLVISPDGRVTDISVSRSSGYEALDDAALAAVRRWRWSPKMVDGRAVAITGLVTIPFVLKDG